MSIRSSIMKATVMGQQTTTSYLNSLNTKNTMTYGDRNLETWFETGKNVIVLSLLILISILPLL